MGISIHEMPSVVQRCTRFSPDVMARRVCTGSHRRLRTDSSSETAECSVRLSVHQIHTLYGIWSLLVAINAESALHRTRLIPILGFSALQNETIGASRFLVSKIMSLTSSRTSRKYAYNGSEVSVRTENGGFRVTKQMSRLFLPPAA